MTQPTATLTPAEQEFGPLVILPGGEGAHARLYNLDIPAPDGSARTVQMVAIKNARSLQGTDYRIDVMRKSHPDLYAKIAPQIGLEPSPDAEAAPGGDEDAEDAHPSRNDMIAFLREKEVAFKGNISTENLIKLYKANVGDAA